jgi:hypothetical protein
MDAASFSEGEKRYLYQSFRRCIYQDEIGQIFSLYRSNKLVTALGDREMTLGQVVRVHRVVDESKCFETKVVQIWKVGKFAILESNEDMYPIAPGVLMPYLGQRFAVAYLAEGDSEPKFEMGVVTSVEDDVHLVGSIMTKNQILNGGGLFSDQTYDIIGICNHLSQDTNGDGDHESYTVHFTPAGDFS